jgi:hypothetical protein
VRRITYSLVAFVIALSAFAQQPPAPPQLTWIRYYEAQPGKGEDFTKLLAGESKDIFAPLIADKKIVGWGIAVPMSHTAESWTHVVYIALADWSAVEAMSQAFEAADAKSTPAELKKLDDAFMATLKPGSIRDVVIRHLSQGPPSNMTKPKYIGVDTYVIKQGRFEDAAGLFNEWAKPVFGGIAANGKLGPWGLSMQDMVTTPGWTHMVWYFMNDLTALDEAGAAQMALGPMKLKGYDVRLRDLSEPEKHQGQILRIVYQQP